MGSTYRATPSTGSRKAQVLRAIKQHYREWGQPPTYADIGRALDFSAKRAHEVVARLAAEGAVLLARAQGGRERKILLPEPAEMLCYEDALLLLQARGFTVLREDDGSAANYVDWPLTHSGLPMLPELYTLPATERSTDDASDL